MKQHGSGRCGAAFLACCIALPAQAADFRSGSLIVAQPWSPSTPPVATVGAVYFSLTNAGPTPKRLTAISSPVARHVEIHESRLVQGVIQMRAVTFLECLPGGTVRIEPGGLHVMLLGLNRPLTPGMQYPLSLIFQDGEMVNVMVTVSARQ